MYPPAAFDLLASYFPGSKEPPPLAISVAQRLCAGDVSCAAGLTGAGFDVVPLVLKRQRALAAATPHRHGHAGHRGLRSCGQVGGSGAAVQSQEPPLADVVSFCDSLHLLDIRRALQVVECPALA